LLLLVIFEVLQDCNQSIILIELLFEAIAKRLNDVSLRFGLILLNEDVNFPEEPPHFTDVRQNIPNRRHNWRFNHIHLLNCRICYIVSIYTLEHEYYVLNQIAFLKIYLWVSFVCNFGYLFDEFRRGCLFLGG